MRSAATEVNPLDDLTLVDRATPAAAGVRYSSEADVELDRVLTSRAEPAAVRSRDRRVAPDDVAELPLFGKPDADDAPLITRVSPPRPPLAVRRATPEVPRLRADAPRSHPLDLDLDVEPAAAPPVARARETQPQELEISAADAGLAARFVAVAIDIAILAVVDLIVVYFTMQICGLSVPEVGLLPKAPLIAFLIVQNGGYLVAFTAGGQTLGKMAAGIRVVPADEDASLDLGRAIVRTLVWCVLAVPAGLGFLTAAFSRDHRGLHDRCSGTRVVRTA
jgi:uncharacterized RDD family membrane protein YckC